MGWKGRGDGSSTAMWNSETVELIVLEKHGFDFNNSEWKHQMSPKQNLFSRIYYHALLPSDLDFYDFRLPEAQKMQP